MIPAINLTRLSDSAVVREQLNIRLNVRDQLSRRNGFKQAIPELQSEALPIELIEGG